MTLSERDTQHNNALPCAETRYAECQILFNIMLSDIALNVVMLSVMAPCHYADRRCAKCHGVVNYNCKYFYKCCPGPLQKCHLQLIDDPTNGSTF